MRVKSVWRFASEIIHLSAHADWQCALTRTGNARHVPVALCIGSYPLVRFRGLAMRIMFQWRFASEIIYLRASARWQCAAFMKGAP